MTFPFWIIRLSSHVLKVPLCMLNVSVMDRNRFFNSWVVSKRDINNKLIKNTFTVKKMCSVRLYWQKTSVFTHAVTFWTVYKSSVCDSLLHFYQHTLSLLGMVSAYVCGPWLCYYLSRLIQGLLVGCFYSLPLFLSSFLLLFLLAAFQIFPEPSSCLLVSS